MTFVLVAAALGFAFVSGANDGATLTTTGAQVGALPLLGALGLLAVAVAGVPALVGTSVATTLAHGLVGFEHTGGRLAFLAAVAAALGVVLALSRRGLPTSVTLALSGGIVGTGIGAGLPLHRATIALVLAVGTVGPLLAGAVGYLVAPRVRVALGPDVERPGRPRVLRQAGFALQTFAYGANGAEKLVAFVAVADGARLDPVHLHLATQLGVAASFAAGSLVALRRLSGRLTEQTVRLRPAGALSAATTSSVLVLLSAAAGVPMSSTQAETAALVGATARLSPQGVRPREVLSIGLAWAATLPAALAGGVALGLVVGALR